MIKVYFLRNYANNSNNKTSLYDGILANKDGYFVVLHTCVLIEDKKVLYRLKVEPEDKRDFLKINEEISFEDNVIRSTLFNNKSQFKLTKTNIISGNFYPRIYRPIIQEYDPYFFVNGAQITETDKLELIKKKLPKRKDDIPIDYKHLLRSIHQVSTLKKLLISIFQTVYPSFFSGSKVTSNLNVFGDNIKNLLILSCIEVESHLKGIYKLHEKEPDSNYSTNKYVKLKEILHLDKYKVKLSFFPDLKEFSPFSEWTTSNPTTSLKWYDAYNSIKHNSETNFPDANLENALDALCAVIILIHAQYGSSILSWDEELGNYFEIIKDFEWNEDECLLPPFINNNWNECSLEF